MKKLLFVFTLTILTICMAWAQTTINFDDAIKWIPGSGSITSYQNDHSYNDGLFSATGGPALRQGTTAQDGYAGALGTYSWRLSNVDTVIWTITISSGGVSNFSIDIRRWDASPSPNYNLDYSLDEGINWTNITNINNETLNNSSNWKTFYGTINNANNNIKIRLKAAGATERIMVDNFVWSGYQSETPTVATPIISPSTSTFYSPFNATISCTTEGATIYYTTDGSDPDETDTEYTAPIYISQTTTLKAIAYAEGYDPSPIATAVYTFPTITDVENIATLRSQPTGTNVYRLTGEAILTFQQPTLSYHPKWVQDETAAIYIYDNGGKISTSYNIGDGITGLIGTLSTYYNLLEFIPVADPGPATSTGNPVIPEDRTLASLTSADQSKLIKVYNVTLGTSGNFANSQSIQITQGETLLTLRTINSTDYIGKPIPQTPQNITCLVGQYNDEIQISPRYLSDFEEAFDFPADTPITINGLTIVISGGNANLGSGNIPHIPNQNVTFTTLSFLLDNSIQDWTITITPGAAYGAYFQNGSWHTVTGTAEQIVFYITFAKGKGEEEIPIVLGEQDPTLPVELSAFMAYINSQGGITIMWETQSETGVNGYYVNRATVNDLSAAVRISPLIQASNTSQQQVYEYNDNELYEPGTYYYWLEIQDIDGVVNYYGSRSITFGGNGNNGTPEISFVTGISSIYPNPFNPSATIMYELEQPANVNIDIYNNRGQIVRSFAIGQKEKGSHKLLWDGTDNSGSACGTGIYFIKMQAGKESFIKKAALIK